MNFYRHVFGPSNLNGTEIASGLDQAPRMQSLKPLEWHVQSLTATWPQPEGNHCHQNDWVKSAFRFWKCVHYSDKGIQLVGWPLFLFAHEWNFPWSNTKSKRNSFPRQIKKNHNPSFTKKRERERQTLQRITKSGPNQHPPSAIIHAHRRKVPQQLSSATILNNTSIIIHYFSY